MRNRTRAAWIAALADSGIPCSPAHNLGELSAHPHTHESGMVHDYTSATRGTLRGVAQPLRFNGARTALGRVPPRLGEHTRELLKEAGYSDDDITQYRADGTVRCS